MAEIQQLYVRAGLSLHVGDVLRVPLKLLVLVAAQFAVTVFVTPLRNEL